jgi:hypothetical protein
MGSLFNTCAEDKDNFSSIQFYYILSILFYSILFYFILFYSILFYSILFYSILFYSILKERGREIEGQAGATVL